MLFQTIISTTGGGGGITLTVTTYEGATVTITNGTTTYTGVGAVAVFEGLAAETWTVTVMFEGFSKTTTVETGNAAVELYPFAVYGISRDITTSSPAWARTDDAVGFTATASVGTVAGSSDFDNCYPWSGIQRETLSTGDVMVKIPKFYFRRYLDGNVEHIEIAEGKNPGFVIHPLFNHGGVECDYVYVGAYKTSSNNRSVSKATPQVSQTRPTMRTNAKNKGSGWGIMDIAALSAIQMLILVEFATNDVQTAIGRGYCDASSEPLKSGSCDSVPNHTGRPSGTNGYVDVVYRGIEGFWGKLWEWVDGVNFNNGKYYVCNNISKYAENTVTNYVELSFAGGVSWSASYITREGIDNGDNEHVMLPSAAGSGNESTYQCDACWSSTGWKVFKHGGWGGAGSKDGLFAAGFTNDSTSMDAFIGSRLLYIPA